jgi:DNA-binding CsgD family transcriptional regulator
VSADHAARLDDLGDGKADHAVMQALTGLLGGIGAERPVVVLVDDLQWVDQPSLRWLGYLARRVDRLPVLMVSTIRDGDPWPEPGLTYDVTAAAPATLRPDRLGPTGIRAMAEASFAGGVGEEFVQACRDATGGSPLFLTAMLQCMVADALPPEAAFPAATATSRPSPLRERLVGRLRDRLVACLRSQSSAVRETARALAILADPVDIEFVSRVAGLDRAGCAAAIRSLTSLGLLVPGGPPSVLNPIMRDVVEGSMTPAEREAAHLRAARMLFRAEQPPERVAAQLLSVVSPLDPWALISLRAGAERTARRSEPELAARYLRRALLDCPWDTELRAHLLVDLAVAESALDQSSSVRHLAQAVPLLPTLRERAAAVVRISPTVTGPDLLLEVLRQAAAELGDSDRGGDGHTDRELAMGVEARLRYRRMQDPSAAADAVARLAELGPDPALDTPAERELVAVLLQSAAAGVGFPAPEVARQAIRVLAAQPPFPEHVHTALPLLVSALFAADSVAEVESWLEAAAERSGDHGGDFSRGLLRIEQAVVALGRGNLARAEALALEAYDLADIDADETNAMYTAALASVAVEIRYRPLTERILRRYRWERTDRFGISSVLGMLRASLAVADGDLPAALSQLVETGRQWEDAGCLNPALYPWRTSVAQLQHRMGDTAAAIGQAEKAYAAAAAWGAPATIGRALRVRGLISDGRRAIGLLREARDVLAGSDNRLELAKTRVLLGRRLQEAGDRTAAKELRAGHQLARECGAWWLTSEAGPHIDGPASWPRSVESAALTRAQRRVAELAADGHTNHEIAAALEVTSRAVEKHLTSSYRKLGVPGRAGLVKALRPSS